MANPELERLRAEVKRKQRNAAAKVYRLKKAHGVDISATVHDPRVAARKLATLGTRELLKHAAKLDAFTNRHTSFVQGAEGVPLSKAKFDRVKQLEAQINAKVDARINAFGGLKAPGSKMTLAERESLLHERLLRGHGDARNKPYIKFDRQAHHMASDAGMDKLIKSMERKLNKTYLPKELRSQRKQMNDLLLRIGNADLIKEAKKLNNAEFDVLWNETDFARDASEKYHTLQAMALGGNERWYSSTVEDNYSDLRKQVQWAKALSKSSGS